MKVRDFERWLDNAREYNYQKFPNHKQEIDNYLNQLNDKFNQYRHTLTNIKFKIFYAFGISLYNFMCTKYNEIDELKKYSSIHWFDKSNPKDKLINYLSYYVKELPDFKNLFEVDNSTNQLITTEEYNNLEQFFQNQNLDNELQNVMLDSNIKEAFIDSSLLNMHGVRIERDTQLSNIISYMDYLGLTIVLKDFDWLKIPGLKIS